MLGRARFTAQPLSALAKTADLVTADTPLGEPLGPASHEDLFTGSSRVPDRGRELRDEPKDRLLGRPMGWRLLFFFFRISDSEIVDSSIFRVPGY